MLPNPWLILGAVILWLASVTGAFIKGESFQQTKDTAAAKTQLDSALKDAKANWDASYQAQLQIEKRKQKNEVVHQKHSRSVAVALSADPHARDCKLAIPSFGVLRDSIRASNGTTDAAASGSDVAVPASDGAAGREPGGGGVRTGQHGVDAIDVQIGPSGAGRLGE